MLARSQSFYNEIKRRHSVRSFSDIAVDKQVIENCLKAAGTAPSGANHQPWYFVAVNSVDIKNKLEIRLNSTNVAFMKVVPVKNG